jgi:hypothetical protein
VAIANAGHLLFHDDLELTWPVLHKLLQEHLSLGAVTPGD